MKTREFEEIQKYRGELKGEEYSPLSREEEFKLAKKIKQGDRTALDKLIK